MINWGFIEEVSKNLEDAHKMSGKDDKLYYLLKACNLIMIQINELQEKCDS